MKTKKLQSEAILHDLLTSSGVPALVRLAALAGPPVPRGRDLPADPAGAYRAALWAWWGLPEAEPLTAFHDALVALRAAEATCPQAKARAVLREAAEGWHRQTGRCPFCGNPGPLHLPTEALWEAIP